jgi:hypothetical protein
MVPRFESEMSFINIKSNHLIVSRFRYWRYFNRETADMKQQHLNENNSNSVCLFRTLEALRYSNELKLNKPNNNSVIDAEWPLLVF